MNIAGVCPSAFEGIGFERSIARSVAASQDGLPLEARTVADNTSPFGEQRTWIVVAVSSLGPVQMMLGWTRRRTLSAKLFVDGGAVKRLCFFARILWRRETYTFG